MQIHALSIPLPSSLAQINSYLIAGRQGLSLVDTGLDTPPSRQALVDQLRAHAAVPEQISQIFITHLHIDHWGLAAWLQGQGAKLIMSRVDNDRLQRWLQSPSRDMETISLYRRYGLAEHLLDRAAEAMERTRVLTPPMAPDLLVDHGDTVELAGEPFEVLITPGHSPAHACLQHRPSRTLLVGDHVLPHITPNISISPGALDDPLAAYRCSLRAMQGNGYHRVLPGHGEPIPDLDQRIEEILQHHLEREHVILALLEPGPRSCQEIAEGVFQISTLDAWESYMAVGETMAHLRALENEGQVRSDSRSGTVLFRKHRRP